MTAPDLRIKTGVRRGAVVGFRFEGQDIAAFEGESIAAALLAAGIRRLRGGTEPRGMLCAMGVCQECLVLVNGRRCEACRTPVREGLSVQMLP